MQTKTILSVVAVVAVILVSGVWFGLQKNTGMQERGVSESSDERIPDISLKNYEGNDIRLTDFSGKPLVVNSWAVWCPFCVKELADFALVQKEFGERVAIIAIDRAESRDAAKEFTDGIGVTDDLTFLLDPNDSFYQSIGGFSMPETLFVKADGAIHFHKRGPMTIEEIRQRTQELVQ